MHTKGMKVGKRHMVVIHRDTGIPSSKTVCAGLPTPYFYGPPPSHITPKKLKQTYPCTESLQTLLQHRASVD